MAGNRILDFNVKLLSREIYKCHPQNVGWSKRFRFSFTFPKVIREMISNKGLNLDS